MSESFLQKSTLKFFAHAVHVRGVGQCRGLLAGGEGKRQRVSAALSVVVTSFSLSLTCCVVSMWCCSGLTTWERTTDIKS